MTCNHGKDNISKTEEKQFERQDREAKIQISLFNPEFDAFSFTILVNRNKITL